MPIGVQSPILKRGLLHTEKEAHHHKKAGRFFTGKLYGIL